MAQDKYVPKRKTEPPMFSGDQPKSDEPSNDVLPQKFITPELTKEQKEAQKKQISTNYYKTLIWGKIVCDEKILQSEDRKKLKEYLDELLEGLWQRYGNASTRFPSPAELDRLTAVVSKLGKTAGIKKFDFGDLMGSIKRIENRWGKIRLIQFANNLVGRLLKVPMSPASIVHQEWLKCPDSKANLHPTLHEVKLILKGEVSHDAKEFPWEVVFAAIKKLNFPNAKLDQPELLPGDLAEGQRRWLCYLVLMDLRRQQLEWNLKYAENIAPSLNWLYLLQRQQDFEKLTQIYFGDAVAPDRVKEQLENQGGRDRRNKSYRKLHARPRQNPAPQLRKRIKGRKKLNSSKK